MLMLTQIIILIVGFVLLIKGADILIDGASGVARKFHVSPALIGLTIVAFGTSAPELAVSIQAILSGSTDLTVGNVIGSGVLNILLLLGVAALVRPIAIRKETVKIELPLCILITILFSVLMLDGLFSPGAENIISRSDGAVLTVVFFIFLYYILCSAKRDKEKAARAQAKAEKALAHKRGRRKKPVEEKDKSMLWYLGLTAVGLAGVIFGSDFVVDSASALAVTFGMSERFIALTIVAIGTSLPELVTTITAARKGESGMLVGNIIGSNIFNICMVIGIPVLFAGAIPVGSFTIIDMVAFIIAPIMLFWFHLSGSHITRREGLIMLGTFVAYYVTLFI